MAIQITENGLLGGADPRGTASRSATKSTMDAEGKGASTRRLVTVRADCTATRLTKAAGGRFA